MKAKLSLKCAVCDRTFKTFQGLGAHVATAPKHPELHIYYRKFVDNTAGRCRRCKAKTNFRTLTLGFRMFCDKKCGPTYNFKGKPRKGPASRPPKEHRRCETCNESYAPTDGRQRWCLVCSPHSVARTRIYRYGLTNPQYEALVAKQQNMCALCPQPIKSIDHCHSTGRVRGLLCHACNWALNRVEQPGWLDKASNYLK